MHENSCTTFLKQKGRYGQAMHGEGVCVCVYRLLAKPALIPWYLSPSILMKSQAEECHIINLLFLGHPSSSPTKCHLFKTQGERESTQKQPFRQFSKAVLHLVENIHSILLYDRKLFCTCESISLYGQVVLSDSSRLLQFQPEILTKKSKLSPVNRTTALSFHKAGTLFHKATASLRPELLRSVCGARANSI